MGTRSPLKSLREVAKSAVESYFDPIHSVASALAANLTDKAEDSPTDTSPAYQLEVRDEPISPDGNRAVDDRAKRQLARLNIAEKEARRIVNAWATRATAVGWLPGSMFALASLDSEVLRAVARVFHVHDVVVDDARKSIFTKLPPGFLATEVLSVLPVIGWVAKGAVNAAAAKSIGEEIIKYFRARSPYAQEPSAGKSTEV